MADPALDPLAAQTGAAAQPDPAGAPSAAAAAAPPHTADPAAAIPAEAAAAAPSELTQDRPSLLETFDKTAENLAEPAKPAAEAKPAEAKPTDAKPAADAAKPADPTADAKPAEPVKPAEPPAVAPEPIAYDFKLPDTIKADDEKFGAFTGLLNEARVPVEAAQKLLDLHAGAMQTYAEHLQAETLKEQHRVFNETRTEWNKQVLADPEIGGAGHLTAMRAIARVRDALVSNHPPTSPQYAADLAEFESFLRITGAGDHPIFLKFAHRAARFLDTPQAEDIPRNIKPPANNGRAPGSFKDAMYDNPRSRA